MDESKVVDYRQTEIGRQNWEVCARMLVHDLLDIAPKNPEVKKILDFYSIRYLANGGYTMALPRLRVRQLSEALAKPLPPLKRRGRTKKVVKKS